ncbi:MAG: acyl-CoA thioesterase [Opitutaceae bacterium]
MDLPDRYHFCTRRTVEFADTDMAGIVYFTHFLRYAATAEQEWLRALGVRFLAEDGSLAGGWPRVEASCRYRASARWPDALRVALRVREVRTSGFSYDFWIFGPHTPAGEALAEGSCAVAHVALDPATGRRQKNPLPEDLRRRLLAPPDQPLPAA